MATAISRRVRSTRSTAVSAATAVIIGIRVMVAVEISWMSKCPAVRLAVSRTPKARGRINRLMVSIIINTGISRTGVPSGRRWPRATVG